jgi:hypothetical protein
MISELAGEIIKAVLFLLFCVWSVVACIMLSEKED